MKIAAAYIRVSTDDQVEFSPAAQLRELREYALSHGLLLDERYVYSDEGISGRKADKRPGFLRMISDAKSSDHPFDIVLVHKFDRFARSREDSIVYKSMLRKAGVDVVSIKEPLAEGSYSGVMEAIYESFAEAYSINLGQEVKKGMTEKALRGQPLTAPPFGYRMSHGRFVPHEAEADIVRQIFSRFLSGEGYYSIAKYVNGLGFLTHRGTRFENRTVEYIIRNPVYAGKIRWNPRRRTRRNYSDPDIIISDGIHEPLVTQEVFDRAQELVLARKAAHPYHGRPSFNRKHWLCGVVRCASCGCTLVFIKPHYFKCNNNVRGRCPCSQHISVPALESAFLSRLLEDLSVKSEIDFATVSTKPLDDPYRQALQTVSKIEHKLERLTDAYLNDALDLTAYKKLKAELDADLETAQASLSNCSPSLNSSDAAALMHSRIEDTLRTLTDPDASIAKKYDACLSIIDRCSFDKSQMLLQITYRLTL